MSTRAAVTIAPHRFAFGYYRQVWWNRLIATAFFCGGLGAGLFLVSLLTGEAVGLVVGYVVVVLGKNTAHLLFLGRPERFWRAAMRPDRSWIARGIWATGIFAVSGGLCVMPHLFGARWALGGTAGTVATMIAGLSALFISFYDGLVMNSSPAIPFWNSGLLPLLAFMYAALGGTTLSITLRGLLGLEGHVESLLLGIERGLLVANLLLLGYYLWQMSHWAEAARETVRLLLKGPYARAFIGLVLVVGLGATFALSLVENHVQTRLLLLLIAACELTGDFTLLLVLLRSGLFSPQAAPAYQVGSSTFAEGQ